MNFKNFKIAIQKQFKRMITGETGEGGKTNTLYKVAIDPDLLWQTYLSSFPEGSNQVFRQRAEHACSCCGQFVRTMGGVVEIRAGQLSGLGFSSTKRDWVLVRVGGSFKRAVKVVF